MRREASLHACPVPNRRARREASSSAATARAIWSCAVSPDAASAAATAALASRIACAAAAGCALPPACGAGIEGLQPAGASGYADTGTAEPLTSAPPPPPMPPLGFGANAASLSAVARGRILAQWPAGARLFGWQCMATADVLAGRHVHLDAETGAGKTLVAAAVAAASGSVVLVVNASAAACVRSAANLTKDTGGCVPATAAAPTQGRQYSAAMAASGISIQPAAAAAGRVVFTTPESASATVSAMQRRGGVCAAVIYDEAHQLVAPSAQRPALRSCITSLDNVLPLVPRVAMTATLAHGDKGRALAALSMPGAATVTGPLSRANVMLATTVRDGGLGGVAWGLARTAARDAGRGVMVLARTVTAAVALHADLEASTGQTVALQHSGGVRRTALPPAQQGSFLAWAAGDIKILVSTYSCATGTHRSDVDLVIAYDPPATAAEAVQAAGRAGRDGQDACMLTLVCPQSVATAAMMGVRDCGADAAAAARVAPEQAAVLHALSGTRACPSQALQALLGHGAAPACRRCRICTGQRPPAPSAESSRALAALQACLPHAGIGGATLASCQASCAAPGQPLAATRRELVAHGLLSAHFGYSVVSGHGGRGGDSMPQLRWCRGGGSNQAPLPPCASWFSPGAVMPQLRTPRAAQPPAAASAPPPAQAPPSKPSDCSACPAEGGVVRVPAGPHSYVNRPRKGVVYRFSGPEHPNAKWVRDAGGSTGKYRDGGRKSACGGAWACPACGWQRRLAQDKTAREKAVATAGASALCQQCSTPLAHRQCGATWSWRPTKGSPRGPRAAAVWPARAL